MNRADLTSQIAESADLTKTDADRLLLSMFNNITESLKRGEDVRLSGFGTFSRGERSARKGVNPYTGEPINIPAKKVVKFKAGKRLGETVDNS